MRKIIKIDFDGTITQKCAYPETGKIADDCATTIKFLYDLGYILILDTCRTGKYLDDAKQFLDDNNILQYFSYFNENDPERTNIFGVDCRKISCDYCIDDVNVNGFFGWKWIYNYFRNIYEIEGISKI